MAEKYFDGETLALLVPDLLAEKLRLPAPGSLTLQSPHYRVATDRSPRRIRLEVRRDLGDRDPAYALNLVISHLGQLEIAWIAASDPESDRFDVDRFSPLPLRPGSPKRNLPEEERALKAGLAPNQIRRGMRLLKQSFASLERYATAVGAELITVFPAAYHNAVEYEREGYLYRNDDALMERINRGFQVGGDILGRLDSSTPFRMAELARSVRGRSWAIHDGVLGSEWYSFEMYRMVGSETLHETAPGLPW